MYTQKTTLAIGGGFAGFLILLFAQKVLLIPLLLSISPFFGKPCNSPLVLLLFFIVTLTLASALPAIALGTSKKVGLLTGFVGCILAIAIIPLQYEFGLFNLADTIASLVLIGVPTLVASFHPLADRNKRIAVILSILIIFSILAIIITSFQVVADFFQSLAMFEVFLAWIVLPVTAAMLQKQTTKTSS